MTLRSICALTSFWSGSGGVVSGRRSGTVGSRRWSLRGWVQPWGAFEGVRGSIGRGAWSFMMWLSGSDEVVGRLADGVVLMLKSLCFVERWTSWLLRGTELSRRQGKQLIHKR